MSALESPLLEDAEQKRSLHGPGLADPEAELVSDSRAKWMAVVVKAFLFLDGCTHNGLTHVVNVYLVALQEWTPLEASWIWFTRDAVKFFLQAYAGALVDKATRKKPFLVGIGVLKVAAGVIMLTTTAMAPQILKGVLDGVVQSFVVPATTAVTLGAVGKTMFHRKHAQQLIMVKNLGVSLSAVILGGVAFAIYPDITDVFYQFVAVGVLCLLLVLVMPTEDSIDHHVARGQSIQKLSGRRPSGSFTVGSVDVDDSESDEEEERDNEGVKKQNDEPEEEEKAGEGEEGDGAKKEKTAEYTAILSIRDMFGDSTRKKSLIYLSLTLFSYHLVNATVLPLLGQYIGNRNPDDRNVLPAMAGLLVMKEMGSFFTNWFLIWRLKKKNYKPILLAGCGFLLLRLVLVSVLINYTDNLWALGCTNILEGIGIGCLDLVLTLYSHLLSRQTGHYNLNMGLVSTSKTLGSALSIVLGGALATFEDYNVTFPILTAMVIFPLFFATQVHTPNLYGKVSA